MKLHNHFHCYSCLMLINSVDLTCFIRMISHQFKGPLKARNILISLRCINNNFLFDTVDFCHGFQHNFCHEPCQDLCMFSNFSSCYREIIPPCLHELFSLIMIIFFFDKEPLSACPGRFFHYVLTNFFGWMMMLIGLLDSSKSWSLLTSKFQDLSRFLFLSEKEVVSC